MLSGYYEVKFPGDYDKTIKGVITIIEALTLIGTTVIVFYTTEFLKFIRDKFKSRKKRKR